METEPPREPLAEIPLSGGRLTPGIMRVGDTLANAVYNYVDVGHWANQTAGEQARRIHLMCAAYGWDDPIALTDRKPTKMVDTRCQTGTKRKTPSPSKSHTP